LRKHKDRIVNGKCFRSDTSKERQAWWLEATAGHTEQVGTQATMSFADGDAARSPGDHDEPDDPDDVQDAPGADDIPF
jgi:hypothetical protein